MKIIKEKRDSLGRFIREQTLGPGVNGYRYIDIENEILTKEDISTLPPIDYFNEIIDIVPAAVYSTGILFPEEIKTKEWSSNRTNNPINNETLDKEEENDSQNSSSPTIDEPDEIQLDQMFPKTMGFTCCLSDKFLKERSLEIKLAARYYKKLKRDKEGKFNARYGLLCEVEIENLSDFLAINNLSSFYIQRVGKNYLIFLKKIPAKEITELKIRLQEIQKIEAKKLFDKIKGSIPDDKLTKDTVNLSNLKSTIYYELKQTVTETVKRKQLYQFSQVIELLENILDHLRNLLDAHSVGYGLWQSELIERTIKIDNIDFPRLKRKKSYLHNRKDFSENVTVSFPDNSVKDHCLKDIFRINIGDKDDDFASLSMNIQLTRDSRKENDKIFVKIQLINTSAPFDEKQDDNRYFSTFNEIVNQKSFFGVKLSLSNSHLIPYNSFSSKEKIIDNEDTTTQFIYRQYEDYGIGHGCSVKWTETTKMIETEYIPYCDIPDVDPIPRNKCKDSKIIVEGVEFKDAPFIKENQYQEFKWLSIFSDTKDEDIINGLTEFINSYGLWIRKKRDVYNGQDNQNKALAGQELDKCEKDYLRMKENIDKFLSGNLNKKNLVSFRIMNAVMFMQLWHSVKGKNNDVKNLIDNVSFKGFSYNFYKDHASEKIKGKEPASWRAFQLAFILLNLDGIFQDERDSSWEKRNEWVDLVWFPTGGGKTEAYLGLIALTIINRRRLHKERGGGTAAIMRYTLRLLTMQQFQRATLMIMALELIRRWGTYELGNEPIYIGFWVGNDSIPNKLIYTSSEKDKNSLQLELEKLVEGKKNKIPFDECPWCKSKLRIPKTSIETDRMDVFNYNRIHLFCDDNNCSFTEPDPFESNDLKGPIPANLCDESIYQHPPTLLFGTVDKFAQLAHKVNGSDNGRNKDSRRIFGRGNWENGKPKDGYLPPDLIIQDELHLLLGPLGSAVGLFESAVDQLCMRSDGTRPKIISSTATTRNTNLQIAALFDRKVNLFPKPGVECDDSFFAFYKRKYANDNKSNFEYLSKRRYLGIMPTGRTQIWMQMRLAAILMSHRSIFELRQLDKKSPIDYDNYNSFEKAINYYHTILSYFNSLKEVGKTQSQIQSYILKEVRRVFNRVVRPQKLMHSFYTYGPIREAELTGRLSGEEVKNELKEVESEWQADKRLANYDDDKKIIKGNVPPEFVIATNMISVGIDVSRFNVIIMNSMPRNTAEYIQASSRVARDSYGLVITVHHPFRARDVSHYERFIEFHEKMYSYVEPISITPFTQKAVDRYMGLYLATVIRHLDHRFVERNSAEQIAKLTSDGLKQIAANLSEYFKRRMMRLNEYDQTIKNLLTATNLNHIENWFFEALLEWEKHYQKVKAENKQLVFTNKSKLANIPQEQLYVDIDEYEGNIHSKKWQIPLSLRVIEPEAAIKINPS